MKHLLFLFLLPLFASAQIGINYGLTEFDKTGHNAVAWNLSYTHWNNWLGYGAATTHTIGRNNSYTTLEVYSKVSFIWEKNYGLEGGLGIGWNIKTSNWQPTFYTRNSFRLERNLLFNVDINVAYRDEINKAWRFQPYVLIGFSLQISKPSCSCFK